MNFESTDVKTLAEGIGYAEGPIATRNGDMLCTSIDHGLVYRITEAGAETFADTGGGPNGATEGLDGIYIAQNGGSYPARRLPEFTGGVQVIRPGGKIDYVTKDPITPNDLCFGPDGLLYLTDPTRGALPSGPQQRRDDGRLWRVDTVTGEAELLVSLNWYPNGIGFSLEDDAVYVARTGVEHNGDAEVFRFPLLSDRRLGKPDVYVKGEFGRYDGFAFDGEGNLILTAIGVKFGILQVWDRNGKHLADFKPGDSHYSNVALTEDKRLLITDSHGRFLVASNWPTAGLPLHPFRRSAVPV